MKCAAIALVAFCVSTAWAQAPNRTPAPVVELSPLKTQPEISMSPLRLDKVDLDRIEKRARRLRNIGLGLTIHGLTIAILGAVLIGAGSRDSRLAAGAAEIATGSISTGIGVLFAGPGAYLWVTGQDSVDVAAWRRSRMNNVNR